MDVAAKAATDDVRIAIEGAAAVVTLDRPAALNALTTAMRGELAEAFPGFARNPQVYATIIQSASPKAFSAGADVREMTAWGRERPAEARKSFKDEYSLNWLLECYSKPTISLIDGLCMGSGVGISIFGTHRVAAQGYRFAMPETAIGFFPDVGAAHIFARLPDSIGMFLGLTGRTIDRADAYGLGLATHCIDRARFDEIRAGIADAWPVDPLLDDRHCDPGPGALEARRETIAKCFSAPEVSEICARLHAVKGRDQEWAAELLAGLRTRSPLALAVTHRHIREAETRDLRETLSMDYRIACGCLAGHDFYEGVRAVLIDKDQKPRWQPATLDAVTPAMVGAFFAPRGSDDLVLPTRAEMQAARV